MAASPLPYPVPATDDIVSDAVVIAPETGAATEFET